MGAGAKQAYTANGNATTSRVGRGEEGKAQEGGAPAEWIDNQKLHLRDLGEISCVRRAGESTLQWGWRELFLLPSSPPATTRPIDPRNGRDGPRSSPDYPRRRESPLARVAPSTVPIDC